ncbi:MAG: cytochrome c biogenesis heme-transporting ATPase CcmA [Gammaproteobacteria bacterium WSBS_2016_MAG_OTU1]
MQGDETALLEAKNLSIKQLWTEVSFAVQTGAALQITGANGAGKTSLLRVLCGLMPPDKGAVFWQKQNIRRAGVDYFADLIYVGHKNGIKDDLTPLENLQLAAALHNSPPAISPAAALAKVGLDISGEKWCRYLSAGQQRRVALARLLLNRARLWMLDEPLVCLDDDGRQILGEMVAAHVANGGSAIMTSHQTPAWQVPLQTLSLSDLPTASGDF